MELFITSKESQRKRSSWADIYLERGGISFCELYNWHHHQIALTKHLQINKFRVGSDFFSTLHFELQDPVLEKLRAFFDSFKTLLEVQFILQTHWLDGFTFVFLAFFLSGWILSSVCRWKSSQLPPINTERKKCKRDKCINKKASKNAFSAGDPI